jgi:hypothetical protein
MDGALNSAPNRKGDLPMITKIILAVFLANSGGIAIDDVKFEKEMQSMTACELAIDMVMDTYSQQYDHVQASCFKVKSKG